MSGPRLGTMAPCPRNSSLGSATPALVPLLAGRSRRVRLRPDVAPWPKDQPDIDFLQDNDVLYCGGDRSRVDRQPAAPHTSTSRPGNALTPFNGRREHSTGSPPQHRCRHAALRAGGEVRGYRMTDPHTGPDNGSGRCDRRGAGRAHRRLPARPPRHRHPRAGTPPRVLPPPPCRARRRRGAAHPAGGRRRPAVRQGQPPHAGLGSSTAGTAGSPSSVGTPRPARPATPRASMLGQPDPEKYSWTSWPPIP